MLFLKKCFLYSEVILILHIKSPLIILKAHFFHSIVLDTFSIQLPTTIFVPFHTNAFYRVLETFSAAKVFSLTLKNALFSQFIYTMRCQLLLKTAHASGLSLYKRTVEGKVMSIRGLCGYLACIMTVKWLFGLDTFGTS